MQSYTHIHYITNYIDTDSQKTPDHIYMYRIKPISAKNEIIFDVERTKQEGPSPSLP